VEAPDVRSPEPWNESEKPSESYGTGTSCDRGWSGNAECIGMVSRSCEGEGALEEAADERRDV
jgi:hypothetical protein